MNPFLHAADAGKWTRKREQKEEVSVKGGR